MAGESERSGASGGVPAETAADLNAEERAARIRAARDVGRLIRSGELTRTDLGEVNNHVHTIYSFSPYSPTMAAFKAWEAGLSTVGIMDHDSVAGCEEMLDSGARIGIATTAGFELRVNMSGTAVEGRKLNSPDSPNVAYIAVHGIPRTSFAEAAQFLQPVHEIRNARTRRMTEDLNAVTEAWGLASLDFERDVYGVSRAAEGGSVTERHLMYALALRVLERTGRGAEVVRFLRDEMNLDVPEKIDSYLSDEHNPHYVFDLLGILKSSLLPRVYIQPSDEECVPVCDALALARRIGAVSAYAYLGDVTESPTGDKKAEKFEDDFLDELLPELRGLGFNAVTYMTPRNTREQLNRLQRLCHSVGLMEISGVDINSSRQSFRCPETLLPEFRHLADSAWALVAHEKLAAKDPALGLFSPESPAAGMDLRRRVERYAEAGRLADHTRPETVFDTAAHMGLA